MKAHNETFAAFDNGRFADTRFDVSIAELPWNRHPAFEGVELKHIITAAHTDGQFSCHLVKIAPNKRIGLHAHERQLETHEVIAGTGTCMNDGKMIEYAPGTMSILKMNTKHEVMAGEDGLYLFAKFIPALC